MLRYYKLYTVNRNLDNKIEVLCGWVFSLFLWSSWHGLRLLRHNRWVNYNRDSAETERKVAMRIFLLPLTISDRDAGRNILRPTPVALW